MKNTSIVLEITWDTALQWDDPKDWDWKSLLDLASQESVRIVSCETREAS